MTLLRPSSLFLSLALILISNLAFAQDQLPGDKYYLVNEVAAPASFRPSFNPVFRNMRQETMLNLISWSQINTPPPAPPTKYNRDAHFGTWLDYKNDNTCLTTRGIILQTRSAAPIQVYPNNQCAVSSGSWYDPYSNMNLKNAEQVQIDHMVPVKKAYISGAFSWPYKYRCAYFNFIANNYHLAPIFSETNNVKMDMGPDQWLPPNKAYACQYIANWLKIKLIWKLMISVTEAQGISQKLRALNCDPALFQMSLSELAQQRAGIEQAAAQCPNTSPPPRLAPRNAELFRR